MTKVIFRKLPRPPRSLPPSVGRRRVALGNGRWKMVYTVDINSPTFDTDLLYVFRRNVARIRRENKRLFGSPD